VPFGASKVQELEIGRLVRDGVCTNLQGDLEFRMTGLRRHPGDVGTGCAGKAREGVPGVERESLGAELTYGHTARGAAASVMTCVLLVAGSGQFDRLRGGREVFARWREA